VEPATAQTITEASDVALPLSEQLKPHDNELALWGQVNSFDVATGELKLQASGFELPSGRRATFPRSKAKAVRLLPDATLLDAADHVVARSELKKNDWILVIGLDDGKDGALSARLLLHYGEKEPAISAPLFSKPALSSKKPSPRATPKPPVRQSAPKVPATALMTLADISPWIRHIAVAYPEQVRIVPLTVSAGGRAVLAIEIAPRATPIRSLRRMTVICRQHGDEPETTAAGVEFIHQLLTNQTPRAARLRREAAILIVPVANPDGAWRKRRRNSVGQDLNRDWGPGRSREVGALMKYLSAWKPQLVVDVHQWVPGDGVQTPIAEAAGGSKGRRAAAGMSLAARGAGFRLAYRSHGTGGALCHSYWETVHRPYSTRQRQVAVKTSAIALQRALDHLITGN
jgi:hypothetical protein